MRRSAMAEQSYSLSSHQPPVSEVRRNTLRTSAECEAIRALRLIALLIPGYADYKVIIVAAVRKLLTILNAMLKTGQNWKHP